jgi:hypothetical protein
MKLKVTSCATLLLTTAAFAGPDDLLSTTPLAPAPTGFESAIRPITNPTLFDLAVPRTQIHAVFMHQQLPSQLSTQAGKLDVDLILGTADPDRIILGNGTFAVMDLADPVPSELPVDGDFNLFAVQFEYAFNERFSLVATKDGYIDFNPDDTLVESEGFANLAAGIKYALIYRPEDQFILSGIATVELPTGDSEVWQGNGDGALNLTLTDLKMWDRLQMAGATGVHIPFDSDAESFTGFLSAHVSYEISPWFIPLVELNWYHVFEEGDGSSSFDDQPAIPAIANFEGGDLINFGAANSGVNEDIVTIGLGFRSRLSQATTIGFAWETPLTDEKENLMDNRFTADLIWEF